MNDGGIVNKMRNDKHDEFNCKKKKNFTLKNETKIEKKANTKTNTKRNQKEVRRDIRTRTK